MLELQTYQSYSHYLHQSGLALDEFDQVSDEFNDFEENDVFQLVEIVFTATTTSDLPVTVLPSSQTAPPSPPPQPSPPPLPQPSAEVVIQ